MANYSSEHGDLYILDDRKELGYNLDGVNYSLHPSQWYTAGEPIMRGHAISIGSSTWAVAEGLLSSDAGKIFNSEQTNTDKCVGIALNGGVYGEQVEVLDHGFYPWMTNSLLIITITGTGTGSILINGISLPTSGANATAIAGSIFTAWTASSDARKTGYTLTNPSGAFIEVTASTASTAAPTVASGAGTTFTSFYANRTTTTVTWVSESSSNRTVLVNGTSSVNNITVGTSATATATSIYTSLNASLTGYTVANPSNGVVTITTTVNTLGVIPTLYVGGTSAFSSATTTLTSTYQYTVFQPSDIGNTVYVAASHTTDLPTSISFYVINNGGAETSGFFTLNGASSTNTINVSAGNPTTNSNSIAATIGSYTFTGFSLSNPSANIVTITGINVTAGKVITSLGLGNLINTTFTPFYMDYFATQQFTTNRALAVANGAPLIEVGIVKDLNILFIDFEGDTRGAVNLSQISANAGEPLAINLSTGAGYPSVVSIGTDGNVYLADRRKANGGGTSNRNNVAGFLVGANSGYTNYSNPDNTVTVSSGTGTYSSGTIVTSANSSSSSIPNSGYISVTLAGIILTYTYSGYVSGTRTYTITGQVQGSNTNPTALAGATVWSGTIPPGTPVVIQKAGIITGFNSTLAIGTPLYADYNGAYNQTINTFSFYTDVVNPLGFATTANSVYVEVGFNTQRTDTGTIGSIYWMNPTGGAVADYGAVPCTTGLTVTGSGANQSGQLNAIGTTTISGTGITSGTYDFTSLYGQIGTMYGGYTAYLVSGAGACSGTILVNGVSYSPTGSSATAVATSINGLISQAGYTPYNPAAGYFAIANDVTHNPPIVISSSLVNYTISLSTISTGGNTATTFALPNLNGGSPRYQMRYINNFMYNPTQAPLFRWDSGWTAWGTLPQGVSGGNSVASQYLELPTTQFGTDVAVTDVFVEVYITDTVTNVIRQINPNPIYDNASGHVYGYSFSKDIANYLRIDFAANGLAYNTYAGGYAPITGLTNPTFRIFVYKTEKFNKFYNHTGDTQLAQLWSLNLVDLINNINTPGVGYFDRSSTAPIISNGTTHLNYSGDFYATDIFVTKNFYVSNTLGAGTTSIAAANIYLYGTTNTYIGSSISSISIDTSGNLTTPSNISMTGTGTFTTAVGVASTFNGSSTFNGNVSITSTATLSVGSPIQLSISASGALTTTNSISTTGSGTLSIGGLSTFTGAVTMNGATNLNSTVTITSSTFTINNTATLSVNAAGNLSTAGTVAITNATSSAFAVTGQSTFTGAATFNNGIVITGANTSLDDTTSSSTFNLLATPSTINIGAGTVANAITIGNSNTNSVTITVKNGGTFNVPNGTLTVNSTFQVGTNSQAGTLSIADGATYYSTITGNNSFLTFTKNDSGGTGGFKFLNGSNSILSLTSSNATFGTSVALQAYSINATSERKYKTNIQRFEERATDILSQVEIVSFNFKDDDKKEKRIGFIADDTHEYLSGEEHKVMNMTNTLGLLIRAVQELRNDINDMKGKQAWLL